MKTCALNRPSMSIDSQVSVSRKYVEVGVAMQDRSVGTNGNGTNKTIDEFAHRFSFVSATSIECGSLVIIDGSRWNENCAGEEAPKVI